MPELIRFMIRESLLGVAIGIVLTVGLILLNVAGLRDLIQTVDGGIWYALLLMGSNALICAAGQVAIKVFLMSDGPDDEER